MTYLAEGGTDASLVWLFLSVLGILSAAIIVGWAVTRPHGAVRRDAQHSLPARKTRRKPRAGDRKPSQRRRTR